MGRRLPLLLVLASCASYEERLDVSYDDRFGEETTMDVYLPEGGGDARPSVMLVHGGAWRIGDKDNYTAAARRLARSGYVAATINYRLVPGGRYPAAVQDCVCALSFLRSKADEWDVDPDRVAVLGYSAGGHLSALLGVAADHPEHEPDCAAGPTGLPNAAIPADGPYDLTRIVRDWTIDFLGGTVDEVPDRYESASPLFHARPDAPPFLFVHATGDVVDVEIAEEMRDALIAEGADARLLSQAGGGHLFNPGTNPGHLYFELADDSPEAWIAIVDFLDSTIGPP